MTQILTETETRDLLDEIKDWNKPQSPVILSRGEATRLYGKRIVKEVTEFDGEQWLELKLLNEMAEHYVKWSLYPNEEAA